MPITLAGIALDEDHTAAEEKYEEVGGRDERRVVLKGLIVGETDLDALESRLDDILDAASREDYTAELVLRPGRRLFVRREKFSRSVTRDERIGAFTLELTARDPFEEDLAEVVLPWTVSAAAPTLAVPGGGNADALPIVALTAIGDVIAPSLNDGQQTLSYGGTIPNGATLTIDARAGRVTVDGDDVTPYTIGDLPRIPAEGALFTIAADLGGSHDLTGDLRYRPRWW